MEQLAKTVVIEILGNFHFKEIDIKVEELGFANVDPSLIKQVWINLISNALKYSSTREIPVIKIGTKMENGITIFYVEDNVVGFNMVYADKLFKVFQRLHKQTEFEGTGVGLAIVQRIINKHGGKIWAHPQLDSGACFYFTLL